MGAAAGRFARDSLPGGARSSLLQFLHEELLHDHGAGQPRVSFLMAALMRSAGLTLPSLKSATAAALAASARCTISRNWLPVAGQSASAGRPGSGGTSPRY